MSCRPYEKPTQNSITYFSLLEAVEARRVIEESFSFALSMWRESIENKNENRKLYWLKIVSHLFDERHKINKVIDDLNI
jgi:hypothetical protein